MSRHNSRLGALRHCQIFTAIARKHIGVCRETLSVLQIDCLRFCRGLGMWKYYEWKQLPNFLLAAPVLSISFHAIYYYATAAPWRFITGP